MFKDINNSRRIFSKIFPIRESFYLRKGMMKFFDLHEYEGKVIFKRNGARVENFALVKSSEEAVEQAKKMSGKVVLKCQVHAGGRGKGHLTSGLKGGVQICNNLEDVRNFSKQMLGHNLITIQTPKEGLPVNSLLVSEMIDVKKQFYLAILLDRKYGGPVILASNEGGVNIEDVAKNNPNAIIVQPINIKLGLTDENINNVVSKLDLDINQRYQASDQLRKVFDMFIKYDATQIEINPWAVDSSGKLYLLDAKVKIDESASFRQNELLKLKKESETSEIVDPNEEKANEVGINYVGLQGNIGCMVNGAGLAMATMDIIKLKGGDPANFLDVGGGADEGQVTKAFEILNNHPKVKAILVNIFGGIMKCDVIANGVIKAATATGVRVPVVIRLTGTNSSEGRKIIQEFANQNKGKFSFLAAGDLDEAANLAVSVTK